MGESSIAIVLRRDRRGRERLANLVGGQVPRDLRIVPRGLRMEGLPIAIAR